MIVGLIIFIILLIVVFGGIYFLYKKFAPCPDGEIKDSSLNNKCRKKCEENETYDKSSNSCIICKSPETQCLDSSGNCIWDSTGKCCTTDKCIVGKPCKNPCGTEKCCNKGEYCNNISGECQTCPIGKILCDSVCWDQEKCINNQPCNKVCIDAKTNKQTCETSNCITKGDNCYCCPINQKYIEKEGETDGNGKCRTLCSNVAGFCEEGEFCINNKCEVDTCQWQDVNKYDPENINTKNGNINVCSIIDSNKNINYIMVNDPLKFNNQDMTKIVSLTAGDISKCSQDYCLSKLKSKNLTNGNYIENTGECSGNINCIGMLPSRNNVNCNAGISCCYDFDEKNKLVFTGKVCSLGMPCFRNKCICRNNTDTNCIPFDEASNLLCNKNGKINMKSDPRVQDSQICNCNPGYAGNLCQRFINLTNPDDIGLYTIPNVKVKGFSVMPRFAVLALPTVVITVKPTKDFNGTCVTTAGNYWVIYECSFGIGNVAVDIVVDNELFSMRQDGPRLDYKDPYIRYGTFTNYKIIPSNHLNPGLVGVDDYNENITVPVVLVGHNHNIT